MLRATIAEVSERARRAGVDVEITGPLLLCWVDAGRTRLILHNLVGNAVKYRDRSKDERWVVIRTEEEQTGDPDSGEGEEDRVVIRIEDNGVGIPRAEQEKVSDHFYRGQASDVSGSGLGLAIARGAARTTNFCTFSISGSWDLGTTTFSGRSVEARASRASSGRQVKARFLG